MVEQKSMEGCSVKPGAILFVAVLLAVTLGTLTTVDAAAKITTPEGFVGNNAPGLTLKTIDGKQLGLKDSPGYVHVLYFWTVACPPCRTVAPVMDSIHKSLGPMGVRVIGVNPADTAESIKRYAQTNGYSFFQVADTSGAVARALKVYATPTLVVIDRRGVVREAKVGVVEGSSWDGDFRNLVKKLAEER